MHYPPLATHPLHVPVQTPAQAQAVLESLAAWEPVAWGQSGIHARPEADLALIPGLAELGEDPSVWKRAWECRVMEAICVNTWADKQAWAAHPELGLSPLAGMVGFTVSYQFNGPDENVTMSITGFLFDAAMKFPNPEANKSLERLRARWSETHPDSPLRGILRMLANRKPQQWVADFSSPEALLGSLLPPEIAAFRQAQMLEHGLPVAAQPRPSAGPARL